ncbi:MULTISPECIES: carbohydrate ABC transporter permease [Dictyoglomus]|uniref:Binding-protein-dependent transport systems inner membrane component n=1 Tax=Dictyoglomus turgidum (strain DSM 6724 / Z-1310) TaxID=515635 RepID=B8E1V8_DICTD|nr:MULTISPECIES: carbohydrate ABC transporter permease [Dictyoglomus]ACK41741.1 binding-protein-dependent transport systems inner membrane component [Dictyoglomus turgidum DSM 6724]HBU31762.1 carbohydrate ABC transporter permease [Dictyoglomus sp.]
MRKKTLNTIIYYTFVTIIAFFMVYPALWMLSSSFKQPWEIFGNILSLIPKEPTLHNYKEGWQGFGGITFATFFKNSFIIAGLNTIGTVLSSTIVAYGLSRIPFPGRRMIFTTVILTLMLPMQVQIVPRYILFSKLGWINTFYPLIVPAFLGGPFFIFMVMQFIRGIPKELDESAFIDGADRIKIFYYVILPNLKPVVTTAAIFAFYWAWNDFMGPLVYLNSPEKYPVSVALRAFSDPSAVTNWGAVFAMSTLSLIPVLVIFVLFQKYIVQGVTTTGLRG